MSFTCYYFVNINSSVKLHEKHKVLDLFSGCGGMFLEFEQAGFEIKLGIDNGDESLLMWNVMKQLIKTLDESVRVVQKEDKKELVEA